ncbi:MBL fold metallo-hydrolase [Alteromonas lipolytica]|uniref:Metallo-beta-lactamase domain-containing protein n=1 Tax=Alteromonas lipolytica TaxID=1856405 RepID=A0A1E8FC85_9ALTE|nr:MBL fold metallo-hydrolase [Alteromonas lipolytica]OFI33509.1 hypothetical protein BFC17_04425 [Alteromonas lipolytica]GGF59033.1 zinc metallohydrolase glyoxalase II family protein [Alteromonas lipolytica]
MTATVKANNTALVYADYAEPIPGSGLATPITAELHWLRMPLFSDSMAINCWALNEGEHWAIVDSGLHNAATISAWQSTITQTFKDQPVSRVFATHMHPDHAGMAGWLTKQHSTSLWMTRDEYSMLQQFSESDAEAAEQEKIFYQRAGMPADWFNDFSARAQSFCKMVAPVSAPFKRMQDGDLIAIGNREWQCIVGRGHSPEHACLWNREDGLLISGDQVLPEISSNVSVLPGAPAADPLSDWLASLARIRQLVPDSVLVLPAHGRPFYGLHARIDALIASHEGKLDRLLKVLNTPQRAVDVFSQLFRQVPPNFMSRSLATGEAMAHLACLKTRGQAVSFTDSQGVLWWQRN